MSRVNRIVLAALLSLAVIIGIYTSVEGASFSAQNDKLGAHPVSGAMVNLDHFRVADPAAAPMQSEFQSDKGHGCESDLQTSPDD
jgi:hypothetical protein